MRDKKVFILIILALLLVGMWFPILRPSPGKKTHTTAFKKDVEGMETRAEALLGSYEGIKIRMKECISFAYSEELKRDPMLPPGYEMGGSDKGEYSSIALRPFSLLGIAYDEHSPLAVINDTVVKVGSEVEGAKVVKIMPDYVVINYNQKEYILKLREKGEENVEEKKEEKSVEEKLVL